MNETLTTFLYELANFVVFAVLLGWIFLKPIRRLLDEQTARDARNEEAARKHLAEASQLRQQLVDDRQKFNLDMERQRQAILAEAKQEAANLVAKANQAIEVQRQHLTREGLQIQQKQLSELARIVASSSQEAVETLLKQIEGPPLSEALIDSACQQLTRTVPMAKEKITVESSVELDQTVRQKISDAAGLSVSSGLVKYQVDQGLLGGLRIKTSRGVIDHSIVALSSFAERNIRRQLGQAG